MSVSSPTAERVLEAARPARRELSGLLGLLAAYALVWALAQWLSQPNLDRYHDMLENHAWSQSLEWGTFKHPPFFSWIVGAWFSVFPRGDLSYKVLSYVNVLVGLLGVAELGRRMGLGRCARAAAILLFFCLPYTTLAAKFNANSQLLSVWPWAAAALFASLSTTGKTGLLWSTLLGLLAAAAMLSKYYSGVFLVGLLMAALAHPQARAWFLSIRPWWALAVSVIALTPHLLWLKAHQFGTLSYALDQGGGSTNWSMVLKFALLPVIYWLPGWLVCVVLFVRAEPRGAHRPGLLPALARSWRPQSWRDPLFWLAVTPWALSLAFGIAGTVELSMPWAIPIGFAFSLLWLRNLGDQFGEKALESVADLICSRKMLLAVVSLVLSVGLGLALFNARSGQADYYRPTDAAARAILADWQHRHPDTPLAWSAGAWPDNAMMGFYADPGIRALPLTPDSVEASVAPLGDWARQAGVLVCPLAEGPESAGQNDCVRAMQGWLSQRGLPTDALAIRVQRQGWRFPNSRSATYAVFHVLPEAAGSARSARSGPSGRNAP